MRFAILPAFFAVALGAAGCGAVTSLTANDGAEAKEPAHHEAAEGMGRLSLSQPVFTSRVDADTVRIELVSLAGDESFGEKVPYEPGATIAFDALPAGDYAVLVEVYGEDGILFRGTTEVTVFSGTVSTATVELESIDDGKGGLIVKIKGPRTGTGSACDFVEPVEDICRTDGTFICAVKVDGKFFEAGDSCGIEHARRSLLHRLCKSGVELTKRDVKRIDCRDYGIAVPEPRPHPAPKPTELPGLICADVPSLADCSSNGPSVTCSERATGLPGSGQKLSYKGVNSCAAREGFRTAYCKDGRPKQATWDAVICE